MKRAFSIPQMKAARGLLAWNQKDLAEMAGLSQTGIARIENLTNAANGTTQDKIATAFRTNEIELGVSSVEKVRVPTLSQVIDSDRDGVYDWPHIDLPEYSLGEMSIERAKDVMGNAYELFGDRNLAAEFVFYESYTRGYGEVVAHFPIQVSEHAQKEWGLSVASQDYERFCELLECLIFQYKLDSTFSVRFESSEMVDQAIDEFNSTTLAL